MKEIQDYMHASKGAPLRNHLLAPLDAWRGEATLCWDHLWSWNEDKIKEKPTNPSELALGDVSNSVKMGWTDC